MLQQTLLTLIQTLVFECEARTEVFLQVFWIANKLLDCVLRFLKSLNTRLDPPQFGRTPKENIVLSVGETKLHMFHSGSLIRCESYKLTNSSVFLPAGCLFSVCGSSAASFSDVCIQTPVSLPFSFIPVSWWLLENVWSLVLTLDICLLGCLKTVWQKWA